MAVTTHAKESSIYNNLSKDSLLFISEEKKPYISHDQLFKGLIHYFFEEFLEAFFPEVHDYIDFKTINPMSEEMFTDLLDGESRRADIVIEAELKGEDTLIIIHVEPQSSAQPHFHKRMYHYFSLLYNRYRKPILPIAIFSYDEIRTEKDQFNIAFPFFHVLTFNFLMLELKKKNWRDYLQSNNPAAAALLSKMGYSEQEKVKVKMEFLRMITKMELTPAKTRFILGFFEKYVTLNEQEEERLMVEINRMDESEDIMHLPISWEERGIKKGEELGRKLGRSEGKVEGKIEAIKEVALELLRQGTAVEFIAKVTHLDIKEIEKLKRENK